MRPATNASCLDPRFSAVYTFAGGADVLRGAVGATTTQPSANLLGQSFSATTLSTAGGGGGLSCSRTNAIGRSPSSVLRPERGVDEEFAYAHRFGGDSQVQLSLYNTNVYGKIYDTISPLAALGTGFVDAATLASAKAALAAQCGGADPLALLGVSGSVNIGALRARGFTLSGRQRIDRRAFIDYDYATTSTVLRSVTPQFLQQNVTYVPGAQVPRLPLHTFDLAADARVSPAVEVRYTLHGVSENNTKRCPLIDTAIFGSARRPWVGTFTMSIANLFDQHAFIEGYLGEGQPLALNSYASQAQLAPYVGAGATERFGLPYRSSDFNYSLAVH